MRRTIVATAILAALAATARAEDAPPVAPAPPPAPAAPAPAKPAPPPTPEQAADAVLAAVVAKDDAALKALASKDDPDPWLVADELIRRAQHDAAEAFAKAAPRVDTEALPAYVASRRGKPDDPARRERLAEASRAFSARDFPRALAALGPPERGPIEDVVGVQLAIGRGIVFASLARLDEAAACELAAGDGAEQLGWLVPAARAYSRAGDCARRGSALPSAQRALERCLAVANRRRDRVGAAATLGNIGFVQFLRGEYSEAMRTNERVLESQQALGDRAGAAVTLANLGDGHLALGDHPSALSYYERALAAHTAVGNRAGVALTLARIGSARSIAGDYATALGTLERAKATLDAMGEAGDAARVSSELAGVLLALGDRAKALSTYEGALAALESLGDKAGAARVLGNIGNVHRELGDYARAASSYERALAALRAVGDRRGVARTLGSLALLHRAAGDPTNALTGLQQALAAMEALGDRAGVAVALGNIGNVYRELGDTASARSFHARALAAHEALGDRAGAARTMANLALVHFEVGELGASVELARRAVLAQTRTVRGLSTEEGAGARDPLALVFDVGAASAAASADAEGLTFFLESGRAGALIEGLSARQALWSVAVPDALRAEEAKVRAAETRAVAALRKALDGGDLAATKARRAELEAAQEQVSAVVSRIQREAKAGAAIVYPEAATLDEIRATLETGDALVLYALFEKDAVALVVERGGARIVKMGPRAPVDAAAEAAAEALADDASDPTAAITALADLVVKPLALGEGTKRVLVSPTGVLSYVPFAALIRDRTVAYVPSGTTYRLLREEEALRGEGVLALGDPDYATKIDERALAVNRGAAGKLVRLPATRDEALAVGTTTLLGADATEAGLRKALAERKRWRAVHLACHGLVNTERPALSSLAITAAGDDDGFLTCLDVFRMKVPSDLVVLSACETGKGKVVKGEGIVGLTRAFMFAGSPRVLCSLWKVDDAATSALMTKFYELWNPKDGKPGLPSAEALRAAQEHVRSQEKWKHPYYWAAWVLWGLPS
ncbi:MAG: CHAT domain-containing protein [Planctomycetes bacterium]|nr:CHAT domain-containing protein [Planctomycetota bacterium]